MQIEHTEKTDMQSVYIPEGNNELLHIITGPIHTYVSTYRWNFICHSRKFDVSSKASHWSPTMFDDVASIAYNLLQITLLHN